MSFHSSPQKWIWSTDLISHLFFCASFLSHVINIINLMASFFKALRQLSREKQSTEKFLMWWSHISTNITLPRRLWNSRMKFKCTRAHRLLFPTWLKRNPSCSGSPSMIVRGGCWQAGDSSRIRNFRQEGEGQHSKETICLVPLPGAPTLSILGILGTKEPQRKEITSVSSPLGVQV